MKSKKVTAIILSRKDFFEADRIISAFTLEYGRIEILAKGSRKIKSKMAGHIEPFTLGSYQIINGKSFYILTGAETIESHEDITKNISLYKSGSYLCELVRLVLPEEAKEVRIFNLMREILSKLPSLDIDQIEIAKRYFEFQILSEVGYKPDYMKCKKCFNHLSEKESYKGDFESFYCENCSEGEIKISKNTLKILRLFQNKSLSEILKINCIKESRDELKNVIYSYICDILPRLPKSEEF